MRKSLAVLTAVAVFGAISASAATLGGLNSASLGADMTVVSSCDTDGVNLAYGTAYDAASNSYKVNSATLSSVDASCAGKSFKLSLSDGTASLGEVTGTVTLTAGSQTVAVAPVVDAKSITGAALTIAG